MWERLVHLVFSTVSVELVFYFFQDLFATTTLKWDEALPRWPTGGPHLPSSEKIEDTCKSYTYSYSWAGAAERGERLEKLCAGANEVSPFGWEIWNACVFKNRRFARITCDEARFLADDG